MPRAPMRRSSQTRVEKDESGLMIELPRWARTLGFKAGAEVEIVALEGRWPEVLVRLVPPAGKEE